MVKPLGFEISIFGYKFVLETTLLFLDLQNVKPLKDIVYDIVYDIVRYDIIYDVVYDIVYGILRYDVVYDIVYDISRYDVVYDIVCDVIYEIVYFSVPWFGGVALPDPGRPDVRGVLLPPQLVLLPCFGKDTIHQSCQDPCVDICRQGIELCRTWSRLPPQPRPRQVRDKKEVLGALRSERACQSHTSLEGRP